MTQQILPALAVASCLPGLDCSLRKAQLLVGHDESVIDAHGSPKSTACLASASRGIEREMAGQWIRIVNVAPRTVQHRREHARRVRVSLLVQLVDGKPALPMAECRFEALDDAGALSRPQPSPVLDDLEHSALLTMDSGVPLLFQEVPNLLRRKVVRNLHRKCDQHHAGFLFPASIGSGSDGPVHGFRSVAPDGVSAGPAEELRAPGVQQLEMVIELGHGANGGPGCAHWVRLIDRDSGGNPLDPVGLGFVHPVQKLASIRRKGFDISPLALGVNRVERQGRFS